MGDFAKYDLKGHDCCLWVQLICLPTQPTSSHPIPLPKKGILTKIVIVA